VLPKALTNGNFPQYGWQDFLDGSRRNILPIKAWHVIPRNIVDPDVAN
jgi:hypothetical protein